MVGFGRTPSTLRVAQELGVIDRAGINPTHEIAVSYTHLRAHETVLDLVCRLLLEKKKLYKNKPHNELKLMKYDKPMSYHMIDNQL